MTRLAIAKEVLADFAKLDKGAQCAVEAAIAEFTRDPQAALRLEHVPGVQDDRVRLIRVDGSWSGVVLAPDGGNTYCLLTLLPGPQAARYAATRRFGVNPATGLLEISDESAIQRLQPALQAAAGPAGKRLLADISDADLARLGIDDRILPLARLLTTDQDLDALQSALPDAQCTALSALSRGLTVDEALAEVGGHSYGEALPEQVDPGDLESALERSAGQVAFVSGQEELRLILGHPFASWRTFLHPSQRRIAYRPSYSGPAQVSGGPGTGKTVTVLHRAAFLAARTGQVPSAAGQHAANLAPAPGSDGRPVLLTTFNGNLAEALRFQLDLLVPDGEVRSRIEVVNVDRLAYSLVRQARGTAVIADERELRARWARAAADAGLDSTPAFLKNEWEQVILAQDLRTEQDYKTCARAGRGRPLTKAQRSRAWQAAEQVTAELAAARQCTHLQLANEAAALLRQAGPRYRHILVDEGQDLHPAQWRLLRAAVAPGPDDLFIAADPHQRIYDSRVSLASLLISVRGRSRRLSLNYRTTQEILAWATPLLGTEPVTGLDGEVDSLLGYRSPMHGPVPQLQLAATRAQEFALAAARVRSWLASGIEPDAIGLTARSASLVREAREALEAEGIRTASLTGRSRLRAVRAGTMHAMKGLEFQAVAVLGVEQDLVPEPTAVTAEDEDPVAHVQDLQRERCVLFVACTRARDQLYVSATGQPSVFLPPGAALPPPVHDSAAPIEEAEPAAASPPGVRKVGMRELLRLREEAWQPKLRGASLVAEVAEADLSPERTDQVAEVLGRLYGKLEDPRTGGQGFLLRWPACLTAAMAGVAATRYHEGTYWSALWDVTGVLGGPQDQAIWGRAFNEAVDQLGMAAFPDLPLRYVGPVLMHAGIPTYCLGDYFRLLLARRRLDPGMDAESFLAWATAPGRTQRLSGLDVPARRFLTDGGDYALDVADRSLDLLDRLADPDPDLDGVRLPARIIEAAREEAAGQGLERTAVRSTERKARGAASRPRIGLDPYGAGVQVILPAVGDAPDGIATWQVTADGVPVTVRSRAQWVGAAEAAPETAHPLARPVRTVHVSLAGWQHVSELDVIQPADPILFFAEDGRRLPGQLPLPPDHVWILRPAERALLAVGELRAITEMPAPFGWEGWHLQLASLEKARSLSLAGGPAHVVQGYARPRLLLDSPVAGVTTPYGSPVYPQPPRLWLPDSPGSVVAWHVDVRPAAGGASLLSREISEGGAVDIWDDVPRPVLGAFDVTVRGPLGRGMRRTIFVAEGISVRYQPPVRALRLSGLEPCRAELHAPVGAAVSPDRLSFRESDQAHVAELRAGSETEPVLVTPPHVDLLCPGAGAGTWTAAPVHATSEAIADLGRLLVRAPGTPVRADLEVWAGAQRVQTIPASGGNAPGLTGYDLPRAGATVAHHGRAEFRLPWGQSLMPVGFLRPRRLATGADVSSGRLVIEDCAQVDGLAAAVYLVLAPWREPVIVPIAGDGVADLPPGVREAGPLRVLLRVEDPWTVTDWPSWPGSSAYRCDAPGVPAGRDPEEEALCTFLAGKGDLPPLPGRLERLWQIVHCADDLIASGAPAGLREHCSAALRDQPGRAITALLDAGLEAAACVAELISTGLAAEWPTFDADVRVAERLWSVIPAAAAILSSRLLAGAGEPAGETLRVLQEAALAQCGPDLAAVLAGSGDPDARAGQFGPDAERMAVLSAEQVDALWQAAAVVPKTLLDADTRAIAARQMFDARRTPELAGAAREATSVIRSAERLLAGTPYRAAVTQISARRHPDGKGGWLALPAMSVSLALVARVAARGNAACRIFERSCRARWASLARRAPDLAGIDLVLAEALVASAEEARLVKETA